MGRHRSLLIRPADPQLPNAFVCILTPHLLVANEIDASHEELRAHTWGGPPGGGKTVLNIRRSGPEYREEWETASRCPAWGQGKVKEMGTHEMRGVVPR